MIYFLRVSFVLLGLSLVNLCSAQRNRTIPKQEGFIIDLVLGSNFSQLDGDDLQGYSMLGLRTGAQINYHIYTSGGVNVGLFYEEKGSSSSFSLIKRTVERKTRLQYLSIPVDFFFLGGYNPLIKKHRFKYNLGISIGRLFNVDSTEPRYIEVEKSFETFDIAANIGLTYSLSKKSGLNLRLERSFSPILNEDLEKELKSLTSYQFSLQYLYTL